MLKKGDVTRAALLEIGKELFSEKGYSAVTMKDFCERSGLSRGGLYRHFDSTREIFIAILDADRENTSAELDKAISNGVSAQQMLNHFIKQQQLEVQNGGGRLSIAIYEFCTIEVEKKDYLNNRFTQAVDTLMKVIKYGQSRQEFLDCDEKEIARHIIVFLEGLRLSSAVVAFSETMLKKQFKLVYEMVVGNDEQFSI